MDGGRDVEVKRKARRTTQWRKDSEMRLRDGGENRKERNEKKTNR